MKKHRDTSDSIYEYKVKRCPVHEWVAAKILTWLGIDVQRAKQYCSVSTCKAVLICATSDFKRFLNPPEYKTPGFDRE
jgi:hypothetical protein